MSSFRKPYMILREGSGSYVMGEYVPGARSTATIMASVQPVKAGQDMQALPEGRRLGDMRKIYTSTPLQVTGTGVQPDIIVSGGYGYEIVDMDVNQSDVINHYKYTAAKVLTFTSAADWTSGATKRFTNDG